MVYPRVAEQLSPWFLAALIYTAVGWSFGDGPLGWPQRILVAAGAAASFGGSAFIGVIWYDMIRHGRRADFGAVLLALILGVSVAAGTLVGALIAAGAPGGARRVVRWAGPVGIAGSLALVTYGFFHRW